MANLAIAGTQAYTCNGSEEKAQRNPGSVSQVDAGLRELCPLKQ